MYDYIIEIERRKEIERQVQIQIPLYLPTEDDYRREEERRDRERPIEPERGVYIF